MSDFCSANSLSSKKPLSWVRFLFLVCPDLFWKVLSGQASFLFSYFVSLPSSFLSFSPFANQSPVICSWSDCSSVRIAGGLPIRGSVV